MAHFRTIDIAWSNGGSEVPVRSIFLMPVEKEIPRKQGAQEKANEWSLCTSRLGSRVRETHYVPRNALSTQLPNSVLRGNHIATRTRRCMAGRVLVEFCLVHPEQEFTLFFLDVRCRVVPQLAYPIVRGDLRESFQRYPSQYGKRTRRWCLDELIF
jgi:hypothetical protein